LSVTDIVFFHSTPYYTETCFGYASRLMYVTTSSWNMPGANASLSGILQEGRRNGR
jgi:hypothetical protein